MIQVVVGRWKLSGRTPRDLAKQILDREPFFGSFVGFGELSRQIETALENGKGRIGGFPEYGNGSWFYQLEKLGGEEEKEDLFFNSHGDPYVPLSDGEQCDSEWGTPFGVLRLATKEDAAQYGIVLPRDEQGRSPWRQAYDTGNLVQDPEGLEMDYLPRPLTTK